MKPHLQKGQYVEKRFRASSDEIEIKEDDEGRKRVRIPISSTALDRDGDEFSREGLEHERDQINEGKIPAFLDHGRGSRGGWYGALGIVGTWADASIETESHENKAADDSDEKEVDVLYADFVPTEANEDAADIVALLEDDMPVGASVGFRIIDYEHNRDEDKFVFNAVDLLEVSIVGIPSNPLTVNQGAGAASAKALGSPDVARWPAGLNPVGQAVAVRSPGPTPLTLDSAAYDVPGSTTPSTFEFRSRRDGAEIDLELEDVLGGEGIAIITADASSGERLADAITDGLSSDDPSALDEGVDPDTTMSDDTNDGGDDAANDDLLERLVSIQERMLEAQDEQAERLDALEERFEERTTDPEAGDPAADPEGKGGEPDSDPEADNEDTIRLFVGDDADEDTRKEFEALQERANSDGELDLAESETRLFGSDEAGATDEDGDTTGVTI